MCCPYAVARGTRGAGTGGGEEGREEGAAKMNGGGAVAGKGDAAAQGTAAQWPGCACRASPWRCSLWFMDPRDPSGVEFQRALTFSFFTLPLSHRVKKSS